VRATSLSPEMFEGIDKYDFGVSVKLYGRTDHLDAKIITPRFKMKFFVCRKISLPQRRFNEEGDMLTA
jgi:hypothetical protein